MMSCLISSISPANDEVIILNKDDKAPYTGFLFPREKALEVRRTYLENDELKAINESFKRSIEIYKSNESESEKQKQILLDRNDKLAQQLSSSRDMSNLERIAWFVGGILVTGAAAYGVSKVAR